jgi:hypothetical protein
MIRLHRLSALLKPFDVPSSLAILPRHLTIELDPYMHRYDDTRLAKLPIADHVGENGDLYLLRENINLLVEILVQASRDLKKWREADEDHDDNTVGTPEFRWPFSSS